MRRAEIQALGEPADHLQRAGDGVAGALRPARMARAAMHRDGDVDAAAVAETDAVAGAVEDRHFGAHAGRLDDAADRVMTAGLARDAAEEHHLSGNGNFRGEDGLQREEDRGERRLLFAQALAQHHLARQSVLSAVSHLAAVWIGHGRGRLRHRIGDQHQRPPAFIAAERRAEIAHSIAADIGDPHLAQPRLDRLVDESAKLRFRLEQRGERARHARKLDHQRLGTLRRDLQQHGVEIGGHGGGYAFYAAVSGGEPGLDDAAVDLAGPIQRQRRHDVDEARMRIGRALVEAKGLELVGCHAGALAHHHHGGWRSPFT